MSAPRVGVVGHVEWVEFAVVDRLPGPGEVVHARDVFGAPGSGGAVAAVQLRRLAGAACFFCALGDDVAAHSRAALEELGVDVHGAARSRAQRRCFCHVDGRGERAITVLGERMVPRGEDPLPWDRLGALDALRAAGVQVDVLVASAADGGEAAAARELAPGLLVITAGAGGGSWTAADGAQGTWAAVAPPGPPPTPTAAATPSPPG